LEKIGCSILTVYSDLNNSNPTNKDLIYIPNQKTPANNVRLATLLPDEPKEKEIFKSMKNIKDTSKVNESSMITKEDKQTSTIPELILNSGKSKSKLSGENSKMFTPKTKKRIDNLSNTSVFPVT